MQSLNLPRPRWALLFAALLVATLLPALGAAPASATGACTSDDKAQQEESSSSTTLGGDSGTCDDITPPDTVITKMTPVPNKNGLTKTQNVAFEFKAVVSDDDPGPWTFMCRLSTKPDVATFEECGGAGQAGQTTGATTYTNLPDTLSGHVFEVYAVDAHDSEVDYTHTEESPPLFPSVTYTEDEAAFPDSDVESPSEVTWKQDTDAPSTLIKDRPYDEENPKFPMVESKDFKIQLDSDEGSSEEPVDFACTLDGQNLPCAQGVFTFKQLTPGDHRFEAAAIDRAGNVSAKPDSIRFAVPRNLTAPKKSGWATRRSGGYFARDYLESNRVGSSVSIPGKNVRELRLIAPAGPNLGKVEVRIGSGIWRTVNLQSKNYERFHVYFVRDQYDPLVSGRIFIRVKSVPEFGFARVDAVLAH